MKRIKRKGAFVVIEGTDGSGKSVQAGLLKSFLENKGFKVKKKGLKDQQMSLLEDFLENKGFKVETDDYPRYEGFWGKLAGNMLINKYGPLFEIDPHLAVLPYLIDEYWGSQRIKRLVDQGCFVISNRYFTSNVHQIAKLKGQAKKEFRDWVWEAGWKQMKIYKPDLVIVLTVPPTVAAKLIEQKQKRGYTKGAKKDEAEKI